MTAVNTTTASPHAEAAGMGLAMLVIGFLALVFLPVTLLVIFVVRSQEWLPRLIDWAGRRFTPRGAR
jgi:hypothetical protein